MYIITDEQGIIHAITNEMEKLKNGTIKIPGKILAFLDTKVYEVSNIPPKVEIYKYTYKEETGFELIVEPSKPALIEDRVTDLETVSVDTLNAIAEVYEETIIQSDEATAGMIATAEIFEYVLSLEDQLFQLKVEIQELKGSGI